MAALAVLALALSGCGGGAGSSGDGEGDSGGSGSGSAATTPAPESTPAGPVGLESTDFGNLTWQVRQGGHSPDTVALDLVNGAATLDSAEYTIGEVVLSEFTGDELVDAAVQITGHDGNGLDDQWYLWVATEDGPVQVTLPIARMSRCGTATHSVTAVEGGVRVHETRRTIGDEGIACAEQGTDERIRTVAAVELASQDRWWPVQTAPVGGFGGLCPIAADYEAYPFSGQLFGAPDSDTSEVAQGTELGVFPLESWPVYDGVFDGWQLVGIHTGEMMSCAWVESS